MWLGEVRVNQPKRLGYYNISTTNLIVFSVLRRQSSRNRCGEQCLHGVTVENRDLKIRGRDKLRRLPEVNLHNEACAHEAQTRVLAVLGSPRTPFSLFCRRLENVSIRGLFSPTIRRYRFPFQIF